jgi:D-glucosaminate-6-phosphate ammonia-lyase
MPNVYEKFGVTPIINAKGPSTRLSGALMAPEVAAAMEEASRYCVDITELQAAASRRIAEATGAEAGYVTAGAAAGLLLATAACVTGLDPGKMNRLPDTTGMKNEVIVARSQRNFYDHAVRGAGVKLVEVGIADRFAGAGVRDAEAWEYADAITDATAAILYVASAKSRPGLPEIVAIAKARGIPVIVDAAAQLPPAGNLRRYIAEGADLVVYSGGKAIRGPQASGILCGKRDLIMAAALQQLDLDIFWEQWSPPSSLIDKARLPGLPHTGVGRPAKVGKEEIVGLLTALDIFLSEDPVARRMRWLKLAHAIADGLKGLNHASVRVLDGPKQEIPAVELMLDEQAAGIGALELVRVLQNGRPGIHADPSRVDDGAVVFGTMCLKSDEPVQIAKRVREILTNGGRA